MTIQPPPRRSIDFTVPAPGIVSPERDFEGAPCILDQRDAVIDVAHHPAR